MDVESIRLGPLVPLAAAFLACSGSTGSTAGGPPPPVICHDWPTAATVGIPADTPALTLMADESYHTDHDGQVFDHVELLGRLYVAGRNFNLRFASDNGHSVTEPPGGPQQVGSLPEGACPGKGLRAGHQEAEGEAVQRPRGRGDSLGVDGICCAVVGLGFEQLLLDLGAREGRPRRVEAEVVEDALRHRRLRDEGDERARSRVGEAGRST